MREELVGYLLNALEPFERAQVEKQLAVSAQWQRELTVLSRGLEPLAAARRDYEPPRSLAERTCEFVWGQSQVTLSPSGALSSRSLSAVPLTHAAPEHVSRPRRWSLADFAVAAGVLFAATMVFFPAVNHSRYMARLTACGNNLRELGVALGQYSELHHDTFPEVASHGRLASAGVYAPRLREAGLLNNPRTVLCPASDLAEHASDFQLPTIHELSAAQGDDLARLQALMGGSYGYNLGYVSDRGYEPTRNLHRPKFALMADAPRVDAARRVVGPHDGRGQNVLFEDGHVQYLTTQTAHGRNDNIYLNDHGRVAPGVHRDDAVIAPSWARPFAEATQGQ